jgi:hypothetical protein
MLRQRVIPGRRQPTSSAIQMLVALPFIPIFSHELWIMFLTALETYPIGWRRKVYRLFCRYVERDLISAYLRENHNLIVLYSTWNPGDPYVWEGPQGSPVASLRSTQHIVRSRE